MATQIARKRRIGIVGFGKIGQYFYELLNSPASPLDIAFVWNRSCDKLSALPADLILQNLDEFPERQADLIVEVAHISITKEYGPRFLQYADFMIGSPSALADAELDRQLRDAAAVHARSLYVPVGALWGGEDIRKMADQGSLKALKVTMRKHPSALKLEPELAAKNNLVVHEPAVLYEGPVRHLCPLAPQNVNTMACAAIAAHNLGFDNVIGCLVADPSLSCHVVEVDVTGPTSAEGTYTVKTVRSSPSLPGAVTGNATFASFYQSLLRAHGKGPGFHLC